LEKGKKYVAAYKESVTFDHLSLNIPSLNDGMDQNIILQRIEAKIAKLGESKRQLENQLGRLREENEAMHRINKELQAQLDEMIRNSTEMVKTNSLAALPDEDFRGATRQRISELVKEIDECITLLNK
jgi:predicted RNase H-like nuclease (RuvC/YqgF family)